MASIVKNRATVPVRAGKAGYDATMSRLGRGRVLRVLSVALFGALGGLAALALAPTQSGHVGPGDMSVRALPSLRGTSSLALPPFGEVTANTHGAPVRLVLRVDRLRIDALQATLAAEDPEETLRRDVERQLRPLLRDFVGRSLLAALVGGLLAAAVLPRRAPHRFIVAGASSVTLVSGLLVWSWASYDVDAFSRAHFVGPVERAPALLEAVQGQIDGLSGVRDRVEVLSRQVSAIYGAVESTEVIDESTTSILHVSDVHSNPLGLEIVQQLATAFDVDAVLDTGDLTSFGNPVEARIVDLIADLDVPYLFVPGNHDSAQNRAAIAAAPGVTLVDGQVVEVDEVRILGIADPTFTADNQITRDEGNERRLSRAGLVADRVRALRPDVLAVHDERLGSASSGLVPVLVAGHTHQRDDRVVDGTRILTVGSTGATGLGALTVETDLAYEAQLLRFDGDRLVAVDYVTLDGVSGAFDVDRRLVVEEPGPVIDRPGVR